MKALSDSARAELRKLEKDGLLHPQVIVDWAEQHPDSELHKYFTWDDAEAARLYRLEQAGALIRIIVERRIDQPEIEYRTYISLQDDRNGGGGYRRTDDVMSDDILRSKAIEQFLREMQFFEERYGKYKELANVFAAVSAVRVTIKAQEVV